MDFLTRGNDYLDQHEDFQLVGREQELQRLVSILMRRYANSVILVGAGGVGCTALCLGIQAAKKDPNAPFDILKKRLLWLDADGLFALGEQDKISHGFYRIIDRLKQIQDSVLIVEDTKDLIEACRNNGTMHFITALMVEVKNKQTQVIFETKDEDIDTVLRCHSDMRELFTILPIDSPTGENLEKIVTVAAKSLGKHHGIPVTEEAIKAAIEFSDRNQTRDAGLKRAQPERSITLIDRALSQYRLDVHRNPPGFTPEEWQVRQAEMRRLSLEQREGENQIAEYEDDVDALVERAKELANDPTVTTRTTIFQQSSIQTPEVRDLRDKIRIINAEVGRIKTQLATMAADINKGLSLTRLMVLREFSRISGIPPDKLDQDDIAKLRELDATLKRRIYGQDSVIKRVSDGIKVLRVGRRNKGKPLSFLFQGPSGTGKTEVSKVLAEALLDSETALSRFDMSEYMEKHAVARLIGAPPGYEGFDVGGILTNLMRDNPNRVLLFDEIEKAHPDLFTIFLQVLGDGRLTDGVGRTSNFDGTIIIMTTNIGQEHFLNKELSEVEAEAAAMADLAANYRSEFLNRFNGRQNIIIFKKLDLESMQRIVRREIGDMDSVYREKGIGIEASSEVIAEFCKDQYDPREGARGLPGFITANLEPTIVNAILADQDIQATARVEYSKDHRQFEVKIAA